jgi:hypothetical protein
VWRASVLGMVVAAAKKLGIASRRTGMRQRHISSSWYRRAFSTTGIDGTGGGAPLMLLLLLPVRVGGWRGER